MMAKIIKIKSCEECPHCTGPDWCKKENEMLYTCQEIPEWIPDETVIPDWCPLKSDDTGEEG